MVVFVDFEQDGHKLHHHAAEDGKLGVQSHHQRNQMTEIETPLRQSDERINPNLSAFSASLSCYPYGILFHSLSGHVKGSILTNGRQ